MSDSNDIVERLRREKVHLSWIDEAADEIERLRVQVSDYRREYNNLLQGAEQTIKDTQERAWRAGVEAAAKRLEEEAKYGCPCNEDERLTWENADVLREWAGLPTRGSYTELGMSAAWQPIETMPPCEFVWAYCKEAHETEGAASQSKGGMVICRRQAGPAKWEFIDHLGMVMNWNFTHWAPLHEPPANASFSRGPSGPSAGSDS